MTSSADRLSERRYKLLFGVRRSVRYHDHRRRFYVAAQAWVNFVGVVLGAAAAAQVFTRAELEWGQWLFPALIALVSAYALVVRIADKAVLHVDLYRRFIRLERRFLKAPIGKDKLDSLEDARLEIEMEEPPIYQALNRSCHNELLKSEGRYSLLLPLRPHQRLLKGLFRFEQLPLTEHRAEAA